MRVRHLQTGDAGFLEEKGGELFVRYDQGPDSRVVTYREADWEPEEEHRPYKRVAVAALAYAADGDMLDLIGRPEPSRKTYHQLTQAQQAEWAERGPEGAMRQRLFQAMMGVLGDLCDG